MNKTTVYLFICVLMSCYAGNEDASKGGMTKLTVEIRGSNEIDSLIVFDKMNSWEILTTLDFTETNFATGVLDIPSYKVYQLYKFSNGNQASFGEIVLDDSQHVKMYLDGSKPFETRSYKGELMEANNHLSRLNCEEYILGNKIQVGLEDVQLNELIAKAHKRIDLNAKSIEDSDTIVRYVSEKFNVFTSTVKKKNKKYRYKRELIGQIGTKFKFQDIRSKDCTFEPYQGKYIFIDVWATWCQPCKEEYPYLTQLASAYSEDDLVVVSVSIDKDFNRWKKYLKENGLKGYHLHSGWNSDFVNFYDIGAVPRFILIDPEGKIISADEIRPSNPDLNIYLRDLIEQKNN